MQVSTAYDPIRSFMASRDAAIARMSASAPVNGIRPESGKSLTRTPGAVDNFPTARSAAGPQLGRHVDLVA